MAAKIVFFVLAAVCVSQAFARPGAEKTDSLQNLATQTQNVFDTFTDEFKKVFEIKDTKGTTELTNQLKTNANDFAEKLSKVLGDINTEMKAHSGEAEKAVKDLKKKVSETVTKIQEDHPVEAAKAQEYQKQIENLYKDVFAKAKEAVEAVSKNTEDAQKDLGKFTKSVLETVKTEAEKINTELQKSIDAHKKEHKQ